MSSSSSRCGSIGVLSALSSDAIEISGDEGGDWSCEGNAIDGNGNDGGSSGEGTVMEGDRWRVNSDGDGVEMDRWCEPVALMEREAVKLASV